MLALYNSNMTNLCWTTDGGNQTMHLEDMAVSLTGEALVVKSCVNHSVSSC